MWLIKILIALDNGLVPNRRQAIILINERIICDTRDGCVSEYMS